MDKSRGFQGQVGPHGPYWRYFQKSGDVVFLFPFYSQKPLDFLNKAPDGTIRVEGSQLNLYYICSIPFSRNLSQLLLTESLSFSVLLRDDKITSYIPMAEAMGFTTLYW